MTNEEKPQLGFYWRSKAWYGLGISDDCADEIMIGDYPDGGGVGPCGEMSIRWHNLSGKEPTARLESFEDSWRLFSLDPVRALLDSLIARHMKNPQPPEIAAVLINLGFRDLTPREDPRKIEKCPTCGAEKRRP